MTCIAAGAVYLPLPGGILLDQSVLSTPAFTVFATFVAINTIGYVAITVVKVLPFPRLRRRGGRNRRAEDRGIVLTDTAAPGTGPEQAR